MSGNDWHDIIVVLIGAMVTLGVEWIRRSRKSNGKPPPGDGS